VAEALLQLWAGVTNELRVRGVTRSANNPIADYAERLVADLYGVDPATGSTAAYDLISKDGKKIQVKALRLTQPGRTNLSAIRKLNAGGFDVLVVVIFNRDLSVKEIWRFPRAVVEDHARWSAHSMRIYFRSPRNFWPTLAPSGSNLLGSHQSHETRTDGWIKQWSQLTP
jgi:Family of unknown function (DUF6998)